MKVARPVLRGLVGNVLPKSLVGKRKQTHKTKWGGYAPTFYSIVVVGGSNPLAPTKQAVTEKLSPLFVVSSSPPLTKLPYRQTAKHRLQPERTHLTASNQQSDPYTQDRTNNPESQH